ncbi:TraA; conjugal transfer protein TraA (plasmid) [Desulforapulum autotrophicum HRM2]|uniref:TraA conjugal transfer protein TraA n=2 Tax=Desulforapulum autotrophicum TaxID=2296 RepID=C0QML1_DESAH|nr:TraA; conjugal transfer protein TraA [Desulforapulum autotrophicum HRM2]
MAIYHMSVKPVQRSKGRSATAASAYRSAEKVKDLRTGEDFDYTRKGGVEHKEIIGSTLSREELWNLAESTETRKNATTAREYEVALPKELDLEQCINLCREFAEKLNAKHGCAVDICIHAGHTDKDTGESNDNRHAHLLTTTRPMIQAGTALGPDKCEREWSDKNRKEAGLCYRNVELKQEREEWGTLANKALALAGEEARIDHRSLKDQGIDREPQIHVGPTASAMHKKGKAAERALLNEYIKANNAELDRLEQLVSTHIENIDDINLEIDDLILEEYALIYGGDQYDEPAEPEITTALNHPSLVQENQNLTPKAQEAESFDPWEHENMQEPEPKTQEPEVTTILNHKPSAPVPQESGPKAKKIEVKTPRPKKSNKKEIRARYEAAQAKHQEIIDSLREYKENLEGNLEEKNFAESALNQLNKEHKEKNFFVKLFTDKKTKTYMFALSTIEQLKNSIDFLKNKIKTANINLKIAEKNLKRLESMPIVDEIKADIEREQKALASTIQEQKTDIPRATTALNHKTPDQEDQGSGPKAQEPESEEESGMRM